MAENRRGRRVYTGPADQLGSRPAVPVFQTAVPNHQPAEQDEVRTQPLATEHRRRLESELQQKTIELMQRVAAVGASVDQRIQSHEQSLRSALDEAKTSANASKVAALASANTSHRERTEAIEVALRGFTVEASSEVFSAGLGNLASDEKRRLGPPALVRRGSHRYGAALYPLFHDRGWYLQGASNLVLAEVQTLLLRVVSSLPLRHLHISVFDPRIEGRLGGFAPLRSVHPSAFPAPSTTSESFRRALLDIAAAASETAELIATEHVANLAELWRIRAVPTGAYHLVVVLNYPEGITKETQDLLLRLARSGGPNGIALLICEDASARAGDDTVRPNDLSAVLRKSWHNEDGTLLLAEYPEGLEVRSDEPPTRSDFQTILAAVVDSSTRDSGPVLALEELHEGLGGNLWDGNATEGLSAVIAKSGSRDVEFTLRSRNPPVANALIGGAVGQGKSNLLLDIIYSLAAKYSPAELEFHLIDFKRGLEFQRFGADADGEGWLPHVKVLSLESDREFGVAVLRHIAGHLRSRAAQFKAAGVGGIEDYRAQTGRSMSRMVLIIDEFQVLFDGDDEVVDEAVELLEILSRQGRALGIHLVMSSQTTSGVSGLRVKGDPIFAQFPVRISLKNTAGESEVILSQGNKAAADLSYRGEIIVNRNFGADPEGSNERAISAYAEPEFVAALQRRLWKMDPTGPKPQVFIPTEFASWPTEDETVVNPVCLGHGLLGRPVAVTNHAVALEIDDDTDQAIAIVGSDETLALPSLASLTTTLAKSLAVDRVLVIDLTQVNATQAGAGLKGALDSVASRGIEVERAGRTESLAALGTHIREQLQPNSTVRTLVVGIGWQRWTGLDETIPFDPEDEYTGYTIREVLTDLAQRGATQGIFLVGWWTSLRSLSELLGYSYDGVRHLVTAKLGVEEFRSLTSHSTRPIQGYPRVGLIDRSSDAAPQSVIPFAFQEATA